MRVNIFITILVLIAIAGAAKADIFAPSHYCSQPNKPYSFESEWEVQRFQNEVDEYQQCITDFVEEQEDAIRNHQTAAADAIDEWNTFVDYELN